MNRKVVRIIAITLAVLLAISVMSVLIYTLAYVR